MSAFEINDNEFHNLLPDIKVDVFLQRLYHEKDFDMFSDEQKQKLIEHHGKALEIIKTV